MWHFCCKGNHSRGGFRTLHFVPMVYLSILKPIKQCFKFVLSISFPSIHSLGYLHFRMGLPISTQNKTAEILFRIECGFPWWLSGKESACQCRTPGPDSVGQEDPLEEKMATHSSIHAWEIPGTEAGRLQSTGVLRVKHNLATKPLPPHWMYVATGISWKQQYWVFLNIIWYKILHFSRSLISLSDILQYYLPFFH